MTISEKLNHIETLKSEIDTLGSYVKSTFTFLKKASTVRSTGKIHTYLSPGEVDDAMKKLIEQINELLKNSLQHRR